MHEDPAGLRTLLAPNRAVADFVEATYTFDRVRLVDVTVNREEGRLTVDADDLSADVVIGSRTRLGWLLRTVPARVATSPLWCAAIDPIAKVVKPGVRTRGTAGNNRSEWYGATDASHVDSASGTIGGVSFGSLADVWPPVQFGFSSTPRSPTIVSVTTTIEVR